MKSMVGLKNYGQKIISRRYIIYTLVLLLVFEMIVRMTVFSPVGKRQIHFSIDDVMLVFIDLTENEDNYNSIFENDILSFLLDCHEKYGLKVTMNCFYEYLGVSLDEISDKYAREFTENNDWLRFSFHGYGAEEYVNYSAEKILKDYQLWEREIIRITGCEPETSAIRLECFSGTKEQLSVLSDLYGIQFFLGSDSLKRDNYFLNIKEKILLVQNDIFVLDNIWITPTDLRVESEYDKLKESIIFNQEKLVIFTHEEQLRYQVNRDKMIEWFEKLTKKGYVFSFDLN